MRVMLIQLWTVSIDHCFPNLFKHLKKEIHKNYLVQNVHKYILNILICWSGEGKQFLTIVFNNKKNVRIWLHFVRDNLLNLQWKQIGETKRKNVLVTAVTSVVDTVSVMGITVGGAIGVIVTENGTSGRSSKTTTGKHINVWMLTCGGIRRRI